MDACPTKNCGKYTAIVRRIKRDLCHKSSRVPCDQFKVHCSKFKVWRLSSGVFVCVGEMMLASGLIRTAQRDAG